MCAKKGNVQAYLRYLFLAAVVNKYKNSRTPGAVIAKKPDIRKRGRGALAQHVQMQHPIKGHVVCFGSSVCL